MNSELCETPKANRIHIAFFGLRNAGKSTLVNAFTNQNVAIVSDVAGTTTDPVSKAMEILPLGPCLITDTAGLDDVGELGAMRVEKTLKVLDTTDIAVWVSGPESNVQSLKSKVQSLKSKVQSLKSGVKGTERTQSAEPQANGCESVRMQSAEPQANGCESVRMQSAEPQANGCESVRMQSAEPQAKADEVRAAFTARCERLHVTVLEYHRGDSVEELKGKIASLRLADDTPGLLDGLVAPGDRVVCICPIDEGAPKGRLILPQVQVIRACIDLHVTCTVCQPGELRDVLALLRADRKSGGPGEKRKILAVTDSQAFKSVRETVHSVPPDVFLTSFSILFARQKGDLSTFLAGLKAVAGLKDGDRVLIAEGCTHHRQCNDIGTTKIPKALTKLTGGKKLVLEFSNGAAFPVAPSASQSFFPSPVRTAGPFSLVVHCGGCMLTRREMLRRIAVCRAAGVPIVNYGLLLAGAAGWIFRPEYDIIPHNQILE